MCGSLRLRSGERVRFGGDLYAKVAGGVVRGKWSGFARAESLATTWRNCGVIAKVEAASYDEHGSQFPVHDGACVVALLLTRPVYKFDKGELLLVTRPAVTQGEKAAHHRHPLLTSNTA